MSNMNRLRELGALLQPKQVIEVTESSSTKMTSDFDGLKSVVQDALDDLHDKLGEGGALETLMDKSALTDKDVHHDKDGATILHRLAVRTEQYKKEITALLTEAEIMFVSMNESVQDE
jgi:hypothetical protein